MLFFKERRAGEAGKAGEAGCCGARGGVKRCAWKGIPGVGFFSGVWWWSLLGHLLAAFPRDGGSLGERGPPAAGWVQGHPSDTSGPSTSPPTSDPVVGQDCPSLGGTTGVSVQEKGLFGKAHPVLSCGSRSEGALIYSFISSPCPWSSIGSLGL